MATQTATQSPASTPSVGASAPDFALPGHDGATVSLADFKGKALVLYFYPKDDTSGCTAEAIAFNGKAKEFAKAGAAILGVSPDSVKSHVKFREKHELSIPLASDEERSMLGAYGVWVDKIHVRAQVHGRRAHHRAHRQGREDRQGLAEGEGAGARRRGAGGGAGAGLSYGKISGHRVTPAHDAPPDDGGRDRIVSASGVGCVEG